MKDKLVDLSCRIWFIFKTNLHHLIPVAIAGLACFIPSLIPGGLPFNIALVSAVGALATAFSYYSYKLMESWNLYPYDFIKQIEPKAGILERDELDKIIYYLSKPEENNVLLVGDPGCGKTTMAQSLANRLASNPPEELKNSRIFYLKLDDLYSVEQPGHFERRFIEIINVLQSEKDIILFVDEAHRLLHFANGSPISDRLKPYLSMRIFGVTTTKDYHESFKKDWSFEQRFNIVKLDEMDEANCLQVLKQKFSNVDDDVLKYVIVKSKELHPKNSQPRSALQLLINERHRHKNSVASVLTVNETFEFEKSSLKDLL